MNPIPCSHEWTTATNIHYYQELISFHWYYIHYEMWTRLNKNLRIHYLAVHNRGCILFYQCHWIKLWRLDSCLDNLHVCIPWCTAAPFPQFFCPHINKCLFIVRYGEKIIFSSHKLCGCIESDSWVGDLVLLLMRIILNERTSFITIKK